jgi:aspartyl-tRNA synthetase
MKRRILFLKCFTDKEPRKDRTYKFSQQEIKKIFEKEFIIELVKDTVY